MIGNDSRGVLRPNTGGSVACYKCVVACDLQGPDWHGNHDDPDLFLDGEGHTVCRSAINN